jgi:hypothetical protein
LNSLETIFFFYDLFEKIQESVVVFHVFVKIRKLSDI